MTRTAYPASISPLVLACGTGAVLGLKQLARRIRVRRICPAGASTTRPPAHSMQLAVIARKLHEHTRRRIECFPTWDDLDASDPWHACMTRMAYRRLKALSQNRTQSTYLNLLCSCNVRH